MLDGFTCPTSPPHTPPPPFILHPSLCLNLLYPTRPCQRTRIHTHLHTHSPPTQVPPLFCGYLTLCTIQVLIFWAFFSPLNQEQRNPHKRTHRNTQTNELTPTYKPAHNTCMTRRCMPVKTHTVLAVFSSCSKALFFVRQPWPFTINWEKWLQK